MLGKVLPLAIGLIGLGAGVGAGIALRPDPAPATAAMQEPVAGDLPHDAAAPCGVPATDAHGGEAADPEAAGHGDDGHGGGDGHGGAATEFVALQNQFVVPVIDRNVVGALVVMSLTLEVAANAVDLAYRREPKLRDGFLRVLMDHANNGGFDGAFTSNGAMDDVRRALMEAGRSELGADLEDVLVLDLNRQDL